MIGSIAATVAWALAIGAAIVMDEDRGDVTALDVVAVPVVLTAAWAFGWLALALLVAAAAYRMIKGDPIELLDSLVIWKRSGR